jgi:phage-related minor tail protein
MGKNAGAVYAKGVAESMDEAAGAIRDAWQNNLISEDASDAAIQQVGDHLITLSKTTESSTKEVSNAVSQMLRTGLASSAEEAFDIIQRGITAGVNKSDDLLDTFNEYGTQFRKLGLNGKTALGLLSQGLQAGARDADIVADALKEFSIRAVDGSKATAAGYKALGLDADKMGAQIAQGGKGAEAGLTTVLDKLRAIKDPVKQNAAAVALFGTQSEDLGKALFALHPEKAAAGLGNVAGAAEKAGRALEESAGAKLESFKRKAQAALVDQLAKAVPYLESMAKWMSENTDVVIPLAYALGALATALTIAAIAQWVMNSALLASPITWIIVGILLIVAGIVLLATKTQFFQTIWAGVWGFMKGVGAWFAGPFADFFVNMWKKIVSGLVSAKNMFMTVINFIVNLVKWWVGLHVAAVNLVIAGLKKFVSFIVSVPGKVRGALSSMWDGMKSGFRKAINWVIGKWNSLQFTIPSFSVLGQSFGGGSIGVPHIPQLADGAIAKATHGGTLVNVGEGGKDEAIVPLDRMPDIAQGRDERPIVVQVVPGGEPEFRRWVNKTIRVKGAFAGAS